MKEHTHVIGEEMDKLADDARALMAATADVAGEKVGQARQRLAVALERGKELYGQARAKAVEGAKMTDAAVHEHPYKAIAIAAGVGALIGYMLARRCSSDRN